MFWLILETQLLLITYHLPEILLKTLQQPDIYKVKELMFQTITHMELEEEMMKSWQEVLLLTPESLINY